jgi:hypothetical protein
VARLLVVVPQGPVQILNQRPPENNFPLVELAECDEFAAISKNFLS